MVDYSGTTIKGYELRERIGAGGMGAVYRAYQATLGREVAIKIILPGFANQPDFIRRFEAEAQIIARLEHPHIVPLYDYWREPEGAYLVMRYLRAGSVKDALAQENYNLESAASLLDQVCGALAIAHRSRIIHRDIKPANILLDDDGNAYLTDFGIAKNLAEDAGGLTGPGSLMGSPDYLSPEQARSEAVSPQTDIYSLGIVLYEMLTGQLPFRSASTVERLYKHINEPLPTIENLDSEVADSVNAVILKATAKNPKYRYEDVIALAHSFREAAALGTGVVTPSLVEVLTPREQDVLRLLVDGRSNRQIADELTFEVSTVKWYVNQIYRKLNVRSRVQATVKARDLDLVAGGKVSRGATSALTLLPEPANPYKGLRAFQAADHQDFFGRERMIRKLTRRLGERGRLARFLAVVGPSGSGKSSLVSAGLIPALWRGGLPGSDQWYVIEMVPGSRPFDELEIALMRISADQTLNLAEQLVRDEFGLQRAVQLILPDDGSDLLLFIDQFEEIFTLVEDEAQRAAFLKLIYAAVTNPRSRVRVVLTLRADFYDRPLQYAEFGQLIQDRIETILPLSAEDLEQAITRPAGQVGVAFEEGLVAAIIEDVHYQPGALPLLQYALTELFENRQNRTLDHESYQRIGRAVGAVTTRAEAAFDEFDSARRQAVRQMFLRMVTLGEGVEDTRRRVLRSELLSITPDPDVMDEVIDTYAGYRLLALDHDPATRKSTVEVAHEALLHEWGRLREWLNESRTDIRLERQLASATNDWHEASQDPSFLLRGARLDQFEAWSRSTDLALTIREREYLEESLRLRRAEEAAETSRLAREAKLERRAQTVLRALVGVFALAALVSGGLAIWANQQRQEARRQASVGLAALAEKELEGIDPERGVLLALEALENYPYTPQAGGALSRAVDEYRPVRYLDAQANASLLFFVAAWSPDGKRLAAGTDASPNSAVIWDSVTGKVLVAAAPGGLCADNLNTISELAWSPSGEQIVSNVRNCGTVVWDSATGEILHRLSGYKSNIFGLAWSPDGSTIVTGHEDGTVMTWDAATGAARRELTGHTGAVSDVKWSPDSRHIATASRDATVRLWDAATGKQEKVLTGHVGPVRAVAWSPDGTLLASGGLDALPRIWNVVDGTTRQVLRGHTGRIDALDWSPDGKKIASLSSTDATLKVWDAASGVKLYEIRGTSLEYADFSPDGTEITGGVYRLWGRVPIWSTAMSIPRLIGHMGDQEYGAWSPDGKLIATGGGYNGDYLRVWDSTTGQQLAYLDIDPKVGTARFSDWSPDGTRLVTPTYEASTLVIWDPRAGKKLSTLGERNHLQSVFATWSPDGSSIAAAYNDPMGKKPIFVWDPDTGKIKATLQPDDTCMQAFPEWSPDGTKIISACLAFGEVGKNTPARIRDASTGKELMSLESQYGWTHHAIWSSDGKRILVTYEKGVAQIWGAQSGKVLLTFAAHLGPVFGAAWAPDGKFVATGDSSGVVKIWNSETAEEIATLTIPGDVVNVHWSPDGQFIIVNGTGINEPVIKRVWTSPDKLIAYAKACCVTRDLTPEERRQFGLPTTAGGAAGGTPQANGGSALPIASVSSGLGAFGLVIARRRVRR